MVRILGEEYAAQAGMAKYSEGNDEPWCADFTSWVMRASGKPFSNPNSGHWRIPGVLTLTAYLRDADATRLPATHQNPATWCCTTNRVPRGSM